MNQEMKRRRFMVPKPSAWIARGRAFTRSTKGWDKRLDGQEGVSGVCDFQGRRFLYYIGASGNRPDGGPANRTLGVAISRDGGVRFGKRKQPILWHQPHGNIEEGIFSAKPLVEGNTVWLYVGAIESKSQSSTKVDVFVDLYRSGDGIKLSFVKRVYGGAGKEAWPLAATVIGGRVHLWVGKTHPAKLLRGPAPDKLGKAIDAKIPVKFNTQPLGHSAVDLGGGHIALLCDRPTRMLTTTRKTPTVWKVAATYPMLKEGDIGKAVIVTPAGWAAYVLALNGRSVKVWTAKARTI